MGCRQLTAGSKMSRSGASPGVALMIRTDSTQRRLPDRRPFADRRQTGGLSEGETCPPDGHYRRMPMGQSGAHQSRSTEELAVTANGSLVLQRNTPGQQGTGCRMLTNVDFLDSNSEDGDRAGAVNQRGCQQRCIARQTCAAVFWRRGAEYDGKFCQLTRRAGAHRKSSLK